MTKIKRNTNKARARKRKIKARVQDLRSRVKKNKESIPWRSRASESERIKADQEVENFIRDSGVSLNLDSKVIEKEICLFRCNLLFNQDKGFKDFKTVLENKK